MAAIKIVIEVYGGRVENVYVSHESPQSLLDAVIVDWDRNGDGARDSPAYPTAGFEGVSPPHVLRPRLRPWRLLPAAGIQDALDQAGIAEFGSPAS
jgi:hypothetical protein